MLRKCELHRGQGIKLLRETEMMKTDDRAGDVSTFRRRDHEGVTSHQQLGRCEQIPELEKPDVLLWVPNASS